MARKASVSPETKMWSILDMLKSRYKLTDYDLADRAGVSDRTVRNDRANPDRIPLARFIQYLSVFMTGNQFVSLVEASISSFDKEDESK